MSITNLSQLAAAIQKELNKTLQQKESNVKNVVVHEFIEQIDDKIYNQYDPRRYERRMESGGLTGRDNFDVEFEGSGISITNIRKGYDRSGEYVNVLEMIEGNKLQAIEDKWGYGFEEPRHAVEPTIEALKSSGNLKKAFKIDLQERGFKVE